MVQGRKQRDCVGGWKEEWSRERKISGNKKKPLQLAEKEGTEISPEGLL